MTSGLQQFEFEIVSVDRQGEIIERSIQSAQQVAEDLGNGVILEMVVIQGAMFRMGSQGEPRLRGRASPPPVAVPAFPEGAPWSPRRSGRGLGCRGPSASRAPAPGGAGSAGMPRAVLPPPAASAAGEPTACPPRPSGSTPAAPGRGRRSPAARRSPPTWLTTSASTPTADEPKACTATARPTWALSRPTPLACSTCTATCGSGAPTPGRRLRWRPGGWQRLGRAAVLSQPRSRAGGVGMIHQASVAAPLGLSRRRTKGRTSLGSGWRWGRWKQALTSPSSRLECVQQEGNSTANPKMGAPLTTS